MLHYVLIVFINIALGGKYPFEIGTLNLSQPNCFNFQVVNFMTRSNFNIKAASRTMKTTGTYLTK